MRGIITERDIVRAALNSGNLQTMRCVDLMQSPVVIRPFSSGAGATAADAEPDDAAQRAGVRPETARNSPETSAYTGYRIAGSVADPSLTRIHPIQSPRKCPNYSTT